MRNYYFFLLVLLSQVLTSQIVKPVRDFGTWTGVSFQKKIKKNFTLTFNHQIRLNSNAVKMDDILFEGGIRYKIDKRFKIGGNLRYTSDNKWEAGNTRDLRYNIDLKYKTKFYKNLKFHYRLRFQKTHEDLFDLPQYENVFYSAFRNRFGLSYKLNDKNKASFFSELFRVTKTYRKTYYSKVRLLVGDEWKSKIGSFNIAFGYERSFYNNYPLSFYFIKTIYSLKL